LNNIGISKRDGIHPDTERDCHFYYQCVAQNKMREAKCPGDQKFSSYTGRCGPASNAPMPCGSYVSGTAAINERRHSRTFSCDRNQLIFLSCLDHVFIGMLISIFLAMIIVDF
jgi:hypothetical protein